VGGVTVVHLVWEPLGAEPLARFLASLEAHDAGVEHRLLVVLNGFGTAGELPEAHRRALAGVGHDALRLPDPVQDLAAYRTATEAAGEGVVCFVNSYARVLADGWLARIHAAATTEGIGLAGASGSWESAFSSAPLALRLPRLKGFPRFPNPHLRTNGFAGRRELLLGLDWTGVDSKLGALELESGRRSLTRQVRRRGLRTVVVGREGAPAEPEQWAASATFRAGGQRNLLLADNRTDDYLAADPAERRVLARMAWGRRAAGD
jgi:hypothetical protein